MVIEISPTQLLKAQASIVVTLLGILMEVRPVQPKNAPYSILVTEFGMMMEVNPSQSQKADSPILVTVLGIIVLLHPTTSLFVFVTIIALQSSRESYTILFSSTLIEVKPLHSRNRELLPIQSFC